MRVSMKNCRCRLTECEEQLIASEDFEESDDVRMSVDRPAAPRREGEDIAEVLLARMRERRSEYESVSNTASVTIEPHLCCIARLLTVLVQRALIQRMA